MSVAPIVADGGGIGPLLGTGEHVYRPLAAWARLPAGWRLGDVAGIAVDRADRVYAFHRGAHPVVVFDRDGNFLDSWGDGVFTRPHALFMAPDETLFCTDDGDHSVRRCTLAGHVLLTIGHPGRPSVAHSGAPFHRCTQAALSPNGFVYISDGYGNARVHKYTLDGRHILSWGEPGTGPGQFNLPHNVTCDDAGWVYIADRESHRIQVFDGRGRYETQWNDLHRPSGLFTSRGPDPVTYVGEMGPYLASNLGWPNLGPRISIVSSKGRILARLAVSPSAGTGAGQFISPHSIAVDSRGDIYVGDVAYTGWPSLFPGQPLPSELPVIRKLEKVPASA